METGTGIRSKVASRGGKVQLEMGGKNPQVIIDDADLETAVNCALQSAFFSAGQRCTASSHLIVTEAIHDRFITALKEKLAQLKIGDARADGGTHRSSGGCRPTGKKLEIYRYRTERRSTSRRWRQSIEFGRWPQGYYLTPALLVDCTKRHACSREEGVGQFACVIKVKNYEEALAVANDTNWPIGRHRYYIPQICRRFQAEITQAW